MDGTAAEPEVVQMSESSEGRIAWEYKMVAMGNPLEPGVEERANAFGRLGWELVTIEAAVWIFKRPSLDEPLSADESLRALVEQTVPIAATADPVAVALVNPRLMATS